MNSWMKCGTIKLMTKKRSDKSSTKNQHITTVFKKASAGPPFAGPLSVIYGSVRAQKIMEKSCFRNAINQSTKNCSSQHLECGPLHDRESHAVFAAVVLGSWSSASSVTRWSGNFRSGRIKFQTHFHNSHQLAWYGLSELDFCSFWLGRTKTETTWALNAHVVLN